MSDAAASALPFLTGGGDMAARIRAHDWTSHPFGTPDRWPQPLQTAIGICLHSSFPTAIYWGPELRLLYNDAWAPIPAERHPWALGRPAREVWSDIWPVIEPQFAGVIETGNGFSTFDQMLPMQRRGRVEETYWNYSFTPIRDENGRVVGVFNQGHETTERIRVERALRESEERLSLALAAGDSVGTWDWDIAGDRVTADERFARLYGVDPEHARQGAPLSEFFQRIHPDDVVRIRTAVEAAIDNGQPFSEEYRLVAPDGSIRWLAAQGRCIHSENGKPLRFPGVSFDITRRKEAEERLRESEERFRLVAESAPVMLWMGDGKGHCVYLNRAQREFWSVAPEAVAAFDWNTTLHPDDREKLFGPFAKAMATHTPFTVEARMRRADGVYRFINTQAQPRFGPSGDFLGMIGVNVDVTETRQIEAALRESEQRFRAITNSIDQMIWSARPDGFHDYYNERWYEYTGVPASSTDGDAWNDMFHRDDRERAWARWRHCLATGEPYHIEYRLRHRSGQYRWVLGRAQPVRDAEGAIVRWFGTCTDIQEIVEAREVLARSREDLERAIEERTRKLMDAEAQLRQAQKMEAVGQLTGGIAHDFNNMLAVVIGGLNLLQRRMERGDTNIGKYVEAAMDGATRAAALTQRLLAFSRQQPLAPEPLDANRMVSNMSELLGRTLGEQIRIETVLAAGLWRTFADPLQLENTILNLAVNARDAMPEGGRLTIETGNAHVDEHYARDYRIPPGQYVLLAVSDTGTGMAPEVMAQAFDPFFTTKGVGRGTGLGLSQVFGYVRQSGGHVKLYSEPGVGTTVKVYLPRFYGEAEPASVRAATTAAQGGHPDEIVMVVEDEDRVRAYSVEALRDLGYTVVAATGGPEALRMIDAGQKVTLLFTDVVMPEMTGRQLADLAIAKIPDLKVLFTTGYTRNAVVHNGVLDAGTYFLAKPFGIDQLAAKVRSVLDGM